MDRRLSCWAVIRPRHVPAARRGRAAMTRFPFTVDERGLAHLDEATRIREFFAREGTPISQQDAQRLAYLNWLVFTKRLQVMGEPRQPFVSHDPRRSFS